MVQSRGRLRRPRTLACLLILLGCANDGTDATETAEECTRNELIAQCPAGTEPDFSAEAESFCDSAFGASGEGTSATGSGFASLDQTCNGSAECNVLCRYKDGHCKFGLRRLTRDEVECFSKAEGQAEQCTAGETTCDGAGIRECDASGQWATRNCEAGQVCEAGECVAAGPTQECADACNCLIYPGFSSLDWEYDSGEVVAIDSFEACTEVVCEDATASAFVACLAGRQSTEMVCNEGTLNTCAEQL